MLNRLLLPRRNQKPAPKEQDFLYLADAHKLLTTHELTGFFLHTITHHSDGRVSEGHARPQAGIVIRTILYTDAGAFKKLVTQTRTYKNGKIVTDVYSPSYDVYAYLDSIAQAAIVIRWLLAAKAGGEKRFMLTAEAEQHIVSNHFWDINKYQLVTDAQGGYIASVIETPVEQ